MVSAFFRPVATIQVITVSQFLHSHFMKLTTFSVIYVYLDLMRIYVIGISQR
jgi:hypothetical protein